MMKSYLRFEPQQMFGVISSPQCNSVFDFSGNLAITGCLQDIKIWNLREGNHVCTLSYDEPSYPYKVHSEVTILERNSDKCSIAAGYASGDIRVYNYINKSLTVTLRGHRSAVSSLKFTSDAMTLASGSQDNDIILWDMVACNAICKLRGHKDSVTGLSFVQLSASRLVLISVSKDTLLKVWDVETHTCIQTVVGHRCEIWSLVTTRIAALPVSASETSSSSSSSDVVFAFTGCADEFIRGYRIDCATSPSSADEDSTHQQLLDDDVTLLKYVGAVQRTGSASDKCVGLHMDSSGTLLAAQTTGRSIEVFSLRSEKEARKKLKRRQKRVRQKGGGDAEDEAVVAASALQGADSMLLSDYLQLAHTIRCTQKVRGFSFSPVLVRGKSAVTSALVGLLGNMLEVYHVASRSLTASGLDGDDEEQQLQPPTKQLMIDMHGHRSDVRAVSLSGDGNTIATCSSEGVKIWNRRTNTCISSCSGQEGVMTTSNAATGVEDTDGGAASTSSSSTPRPSMYYTAMCFAPGGRFVLVGTKEGHLQILDTAAGVAVYEKLHAHGNKGGSKSSGGGDDDGLGDAVVAAASSPAAVWSLAVRPDGKGFASGGADKVVRFWDFTIGATGLGMAYNRELVMPHDVLCVRYSPTQSERHLLVSVGLLDNTVRIFFDDSLKFFLTLYGHKLPVMCLDISYDSTILVSGSADKTVKIWGLDFGDCHRSLIAHTDSVTSVRFQPNTHYFFTAGKDGVMKYWDADRFEQILLLPGHRGAVWGLELSADGHTCYSVGQDRSIRVWERGEDLVFVEEERERALEALVDKDAERDDDAEAAAGSADGKTQQTSDTVAAAALKNIESVKGAELLMEALDLVERELAEIREKEELKAAGASRSGKKGAVVSTNPLLLGLSPYKYMLRAIRMIKSPDLDQALLMLPFHYVTRFIAMLIQLSQRGLDVELCCKCAVFLLRNHQPQIASSHVLLPEMLELRQVMTGSIGEYRSLVGSNVAGLRFMQRALDQKRADDLATDAETPFAAGSAAALMDNSNNNTAADGGSSGKKSKKKAKKH